jgi:hypothetical protein
MRKPPTQNDAKSVRNEAKTRANILNQARHMGMEEAVLKIFARTDEGIKNARNEHERHHIAACGLAELHRLFGCRGPLIVDGVELLPGEPGWENNLDIEKPIIKLD